MANKYVSIMDGGKTSSEGFNRFFNKMAGSYNAGVIGAGDFLVSTNASFMTVSIATGDVIIPYQDYLFECFSTSGQTLLLGDNSSGNNRIDCVVAYVDLTAYSATNSNNPDAVKFFDVQGTPAGSPVAPSAGTIQAAVGAGNPYIILANVQVNNGWTVANSSTISGGNITDERTNFLWSPLVLPLGKYADVTDQASNPSSPASGVTRLFTSGGSIFQKVSGGGVIQIGNSSFKSNGNAGATPTVDWSQGNTQAFTLNADATFTFSNPVAGGKYTLYCTQDGTGNRAITWPAGVHWSNNVAPPPTVTAGQVDIFGFIYTGGVYSGFNSPNYNP